MTKNVDRGLATRGSRTCDTRSRLMAFPEPSRVEDHMPIIPALSATLMGAVCRTEPRNM